jgi:S-adenosylmethionine-diacylglycerol 3-amino-3-carboxypropyl transferase
MAIAEVSEGRRGRARALLGGAVHRSAASSLDGVLERLFTLAFNGLVYPQIWEDPAVDMEAMEIEPHHHVVAIASGGCNVLSYLVASPAAITAVDLNHAHVALNKLKIAGLRHLPNWDTFYRFFGEADDRANMLAYKQYLQPHLDGETRRYWERRSLSGRRRLSHFRSNIFRKGLLGRFIGVSHLVARAYGHDMEKLLSARSVSDQRAFFEEVIAPLFDRRLVKWVTSRRISLYGLGIPPAQYEVLAGGQAMPDVLRARLEKLVCDFPLRDNYFAWQAFGRSYAPGGAGPLPPYLQERHFATLKRRAERVDVRHVAFTDAVNVMAPRMIHPH